MKVINRAHNRFGWASECTGRLLTQLAIPSRSLEEDSGPLVESPSRGHYFRLAVMPAQIAPIWC